MPKKVVALLALPESPVDAAARVARGMRRGRRHRDPGPHGAAARRHRGPLPAEVDWLKRRFARATGVAPLEYVQTLRLEEAKHALETTTAPVEAVANDVGYEDASFFGRLFRRKVGLTPAQYRKRFRSLRLASTADATRPVDRAPSRTA
jgi:hypothetical protein